MGVLLNGSITSLIARDTTASPLNGCMPTWHAINFKGVLELAADLDVLLVNMYCSSPTVEAL